MLIHRSPAFTAIYNEIKTSDRNRVLDLGPMSGGCFQLLSKLSCKIQVEDLSGAIRDHIYMKTDLADINISKYMADYAPDDKFDVILAWDIINFLSLDAIKVLFDKLKSHCKPNTLVYMLRYVESKIPSTPRKFLVKDKYLLEMSDTDLIEKTLPNYSTVKLLSSMDGYFVQETLVGQMGMIPGITEHVLRFAPSDETKHRITKSESKPNVIREKTLNTSTKSVYSSPAIAEVMSLLQSDNNVTVLDLGASQNRSEDLIVQKAKSYYRADIASLVELSRKKGVENLNLSVLNHEISRKFDVIIAWDTFNCCSPLQIMQLNNALASLSHDNTFLLSFMYTGRHKPSEPGQFEVIDGNQLRMNLNIPRVASANSLAAQSNDAITGAALLRLLPSFHMDKTYAYREGMNRELMEYIFVYNGLAPKNLSADSLATSLD